MALPLLLVLCIAGGYAVSNVVKKPATPREAATRRSSSYKVIILMVLLICELRFFCT